MVSLNPIIGCRSWAALALWYLGYPDRSQERLPDILALGRELANPSSKAFALVAAALVSEYRREAPRVEEYAGAILELANEYGMAQWQAYGMILRGRAWTLQGQQEKGIQELRQGLEAYGGTHSKASRLRFLVLLAEALGESGQIEEGLRLLEEFHNQDDRGASYYKAECYRVQGELVLAQEGCGKQREEEAELCFHKALDVSRRQKARSLELRAATSLARLLRKQGRIEEARQQLAAIYGWFTEGFDTQDLREARALLEELS